MTTVMHLITIAIFDVLTLMVVYGGSRIWKYSNSDILTKYNHYGPAMCEIACKRHTGCNAVNYNIDQLYCELLKVSSSGDRISDRPRYFFSVLTDLTTPKDECWQNPCPRGKKCVVTNNNVPICVQYASYPVDCQAIENKPSGVYRIYPSETTGFDVFCNMEVEGGGWTVFQKRQDGSINFYRNWTEYTYGFGNIKGEFWLGNLHILELLVRHTYELYIILEDFTGAKRYARYGIFSISDLVSKFTLTIGSYSGDAGDAMAFHNGKAFATKDKDTPTSCAQAYSGGWWYGDCHEANLNGLYLSGSHSSYANGVNWFYWRGNYYSLKSTQMMIRRK